MRIDSSDERSIFNRPSPQHVIAVVSCINREVSAEPKSSEVTLPEKPTILRVVGSFATSHSMLNCTCGIRDTTSKQSCRVYASRMLAPSKSKSWCVSIWLKDSKKPIQGAMSVENGWLLGGCPFKRKMTAIWVSFACRFALHVESVFAPRRGPLYPSELPRQSRETDNSIQLRMHIAHVIVASR
jgi:hypothetical protein